MASSAPARWVGAWAACWPRPAGARRLRQGARGPKTGRGVAAGAGIADVARQADVVVTYVTDGADLEDVVAGPWGLLESLNSGKAVIDTTSSEPWKSRELAPRLAAEVVAPGIFEHISGDRLTLGESDGSRSEHVAALGRILAGAGLKAPAHPRRDLVEAVGQLQFRPDQRPRRGDPRRHLRDTRDRRSPGTASRSRTRRFRQFVTVQTFAPIRQESLGQCRDSRNVRLIRSERVGSAPRKCIEGEDVSGSQSVLRYQRPLGVRSLRREPVQMGSVCLDKAADRGSTFGSSHHYC